MPYAETIRAAFVSSRCCSLRCYLRGAAATAARGDCSARRIRIWRGDDDRRLSSDEISSQEREAIVLPVSKAILDCYVLVFDVARVGQRPEKCGTIWCHGSGRSGVKKPDHRQWLLRASSQGPCYGRAPDQRDELASPDHSITSSASNCMELGTVKPSAVAVLRFITSSNLAACITGKSAGFSPLRIRPA